MTQNLIKKARSASPFKKPPKSKDGELSKKSKTFLQIMKNQFGFEPAREFVEVYSKEQLLYQELYLRYTDKNDELDPRDLQMFWFLHKEIKDSLKTFVKYSYPTLRATQIKGNLGPAPVFNINLGVPPKPEIVDVTPIKENEDE